MSRYTISLADGFGREIDRLVVSANTMALALSVSADVLLERGARGEAVSATVELVPEYVEQAAGLREAQEAPEPPAGPEKASQGLPGPSSEDRWQELLASGIEELELGVRAYNILQRRGITTCGDLLGLSEWTIDLWNQQEARAGATVRQLRGEARRQVQEARAGLQSIRLQLWADDAAAHDLATRDAEERS